MFQYCAVLVTREKSLAIEPRIHTDRYEYFALYLCVFGVVVFIRDPKYCSPSVEVLTQAGMCRGEIGEVAHEGPRFLPLALEPVMLET